MVTVAKKENAKSASTSVHENMKKGLALSFLVIPIGVVLWVILWRFGFIASVVSFAMAWLAVYLYGVGAKAPVSRRVAPYLLGIIAVGVLVAFVAGIASDAADFYVKDTDMSQWGALLAPEYWAYFADNLFNNGELISSYLGDLAISVVFALIGCFSIVKGLFTPTEVVDTPKSK